VGIGVEVSTGSSCGVSEAACVLVAVGVKVGVAGTGSLTGVGSVGTTDSGLAGRPGAKPVGAAYSPHRDGVERHAPRTKAMAVRIIRLRFTI